MNPKGPVDLLAAASIVSLNFVNEDRQKAALSHSPLRRGPCLLKKAVVGALLETWCGAQGVSSVPIISEVDRCCQEQMCLIVMKNPMLTKHFKCHIL